MSVTSICPSIYFNGNAAEAIDFYTSALSARLMSRMFWRELPPEMGGCAPEDRDRIMHGEIAFGAATLMIADRPSSRSGPLAGNIDIHLRLEAPSALDDTFARLVDGGEALMPPHDAFWGERFAALRDRFGVNWTMTSPKA